MKRTTNELNVKYLSHIKDVSFLLECSCKQWNSVAINQLKKKLELEEDVFEDERTKCISFDVNFQNGSVASFLFIPEDITTFDLQTELVDSFGYLIKESSNISFNILGLHADRQKSLIRDMTSLIKLYEWEKPVFGKRKGNKTKYPKNKSFGFYSDVEETEKLIAEGDALADANNLARTLCVMPGNMMKSKDLIEAGIKVAKSLRCKYEVLKKKKLIEMKAGAFLSVMQADPNSDGGILHIKYRTRSKAKSVKNIALVGKGIVFDTGGYSIKDEESMQDMHKDMTGAAIALATFKALVKSKPKHNVDCYLAVAENLISPTAYRPEDIIIAMNGSSIEVKNTDAEGRMCLVDTMTYAQRQELKPNLLIDFGTLTGAAPYCTDHKYACVFSNNYKLALKAVEIGRECGERVWNFPVGEDYTEGLDSEIADIRQCQKSENADHIYSATFLQHFVEKKLDWVHLDLSADTVEGGLGLVDTDTTGHGIRWAYDFIKKYTE
jgi:leucyl aminopeptidase